MEKKVERRGRPRGSKTKKMDVIVVDELKNEVGNEVGRHGRSRGSNFDENVNEGSEDADCKQRQSKRGLKKRKVCDREGVCKEGQEQIIEVGSEVLQDVKSDPSENDDGLKEMDVHDARSDASLRGATGARARVPRRRKKRGRPRGRKNNRIVLVDGMLHKLIGSKHGGRSLVVQQDIGLLEFPQNFGNERAGDGKVLDESTNEQKRPRRKGSNYQLRARKMPEVKLPWH